MCQPNELEPEETPRNRATKEEILDRVDQIYKLMVLGANPVEIREWAKQQKWQVSRAQLWRYQLHARKLFVRHLEKNRERNLARGIAQRQQLYALAIEAGDLQTAARILKDQDELLGLYPDAKAKVDKGEPVDDREQLSNAERLRRLASIFGNPPGTQAPPA